MYISQFTQIRMIKNYKWRRNRGILPTRPWVLILLAKPRKHPILHFLSLPPPLVPPSILSFSHCISVWWNQIPKNIWIEPSRPLGLDESTLSSFTIKWFYCAFPAFCTYIPMHAKTNVLNHIAEYDS
jgi:hypothetical protein